MHSYERPNDYGVVIMLTFFSLVISATILARAFGAIVTKVTYQHVMIWELVAPATKRHVNTKS